MAEKVLIGNWKMNKDLGEALALKEEIEAFAASAAGSAKVGIAPPFPYLGLFGQNTDGPLWLVGQNCNQHPSGAYTGEVSAGMLASVGCKAVILGHSERRQFFGDTDDVVAQKVCTAIAHGMSAVVCCGEMLAERKAEIHFEVVERQLKTALAGMQAEEWKKIIVAYEPVWAIGTGETASPAQAGEMHAFIRQLLTRMGGAQGADVSILYGGSCNPSNARELFAVPHVDGGLIGGASLKAADFISLINTLNQAAVTC